jgi:ABC-type uncharacterized transport system substrate-binding protein
MIGQDILFGAEQEQLAKLSVRYKIPAIMAQREFVTVGGLMSYGANQRDVYRQVGIYAGTPLLPRPVAGAATRRRGHARHR